MLFNTREFALFFAVILALYWLLFKWRNLQNMVLLAGSMYFYAQLHYSFPIYLGVMIIMSYLFANIIEDTEQVKKRRLVTAAGIIFLAFGLIYTKYSEFFFGNMPGLAHWKATALHILVPVGISFYTFSTLGYIIDVYRGTIPAERNLVTYASYVSFFPHLLSGPIPSAATVLPQFNSLRSVSVGDVDEAIGEILWGLFKKMVVADNISLAVNFCFSQQYHELDGSTLFIGAVLFGVQIYADFSAYSSMARGFGKLLGINLVQNFRVPLFSKSVTDFWRYWHISLTNWFYTYIFNPVVIALRNLGKVSAAIGLVLTFLLSGIWHGAGWQFAIFGILHGGIMVYEYYTKKQRKKIFKKLPAFVGGLISHISVLLFLVLTWIFFKADNISDATGILSRVFSASIVKTPSEFVTKYLVWCIPLFAVELIQRKGEYIMDMAQWRIPERILKAKATTQNVMRVNIAIKIVLYILLSLAIFLLYKKQNMAEYYYFKF